MSSFENRRWVVLQTAEAASFDFNQVIEPSLDSCRVSNDGTSFIVKFDLPEDQHLPSFVKPDSVIMNHEEVLIFVEGDDWKPDLSEYEFPVE